MILVVSFIVMMGVISMFMGIVPTGQEGISCEAELRKGCMDYSRQGCCDDPSNCDTDSIFDEYESNCDGTTDYQNVCC